MKLWHVLTCFLMQLLQQPVLVRPHPAGGQYHATPEAAFAASALGQPAEAVTQRCSTARQEIPCAALSNTAAFKPIQRSVRLGEVDTFALRQAQIKDSPESRTWSTSTGWPGATLRMTSTAANTEPSSASTLRSSIAISSAVPVPCGSQQRQELIGRQDRRLLLQCMLFQGVYPIGWARNSDHRHVITVMSQLITSSALCYARNTGCQHIVYESASPLRTLLPSL